MQCAISAVRSFLRPTKALTLSHPLRLALVLVLFSVAVFGETRVRIANGNITSGDAQSYDDGSGIRIFQGLRPDVAMVQEFNFGDNSPRAIRSFVDTAFGNDFHYYREPIQGIPNGVVSRFPILESGTIVDPNMGNRGLAWAKIEVPGEKPLWAFSVHFSHGDKNNRTTAAQEITRFIRENIPAGDLAVLGGDLNLTSRNEPALTELKKALSDRHIPVGADGKSGTNAKREKPYDFVLPNAALDALHTAVNLFGGTTPGKGLEFPEGLVFDSRTFGQLSLVAPVRSGDSASRNMQHMLVVKDYLFK